MNFHLTLCLDDDDDLSEVKEGDLNSLKQSSNSEEVGLPSNIKLVKKAFCGKFAVSAEEFTSEMVRGFLLFYIVILCLYYNILN